MACAFREFDIVRVLALPREPTVFSPYVERDAQVGDVGTVVDIQDGPAVTARVTVEAVAADGSTVWIDEFGSDQLELVHRIAQASPLDVPDVDLGLTRSEIVDLVRESRTPRGA